MSKLVAIVRTISPRMEKCELTHLDRQPIDVALAEKQHEEYLDALRRLGCELEHAMEMPFHPDSVFVEDCAVVVDELAIIARPGAESRREEVYSIAEALEQFREKIYYIESPGLLDGGDVLRIGKQIWVGLSGRTNADAVLQMQSILKPYGYSVDAVRMGEGCLHLKSAVTQVADDLLLLNPDWVHPDYFPDFDIIETDPDEPGAANALLIGDTVIYPDDYPFTALLLAEEGIELLLVDNSEVIKAEGGVTCCCVLVGVED
ncbi:MAG: dimethylargininase [Saprospiraceae bacterium]|nr:dimethylargininase [Saprospiraceae bacterium]